METELIGGVGVSELKIGSAPIYLQYSVCTSPHSAHTELCCKRSFKHGKGDFKTFQAFTLTIRNHQKDGLPVFYTVSL